MLLYAGTVASMFGTAVALVVLPFALLERGYDGSDLGLVMAARSFPMVVLLLLGGVVADRLPREQVLVGSTLLTGASQGVFAILVVTHNDELWTLAALSIVTGSAMAFYLPALDGLLPSTVPVHKLQQANTWLRLGRNGALVGGGAVAGGLVVLLGPGRVLIVETVGYLVSGLLRAGMRLPVAVRHHGSGVVQQLKEGWGEVVGRRWLWAVNVQFMVRNTFHLCTVNILGPLVADKHFDGARDWSLVLSSYVVGFVVGMLLLLWRRSHRLLTDAMLAGIPFAALLVALSVPLPLPMVCVFAVAAGAGLEIANVNLVVSMQQEIPEDRLSRVLAYQLFGANALGPLSVAIIAPISSLIGLPATLWTAGMLVAALSLAVLCIPEVRQIRYRATPDVRVET